MLISGMNGACADRAACPSLGIVAGTVDPSNSNRVRLTPDAVRLPAAGETRPPTTNGSDVVRAKTSSQLSATEVARVVTSVGGENDGASPGIKASQDDPILAEPKAMSGAVFCTE
jgi:hypothetical protein